MYNIVGEVARACRSESECVRVDSLRELAKFSLDSWFKSLLNVRMRMPKGIAGDVYCVTQKGYSEVQGWSWGHIGSFIHNPRDYASSFERSLFTQISVVNLLRTRTSHSPKTSSIVRLGRVSGGWAHQRHWWTLMDTDGNAPLETMRTIQTIPNKHAY